MTNHEFNELIHTKNFTFFRNDFFYVVVVFRIFGFNFITVFLTLILLYN